jgi:signal transduction histidine kinase
MEILASRVNFGDKDPGIQGIMVDISDRLEVEQIKKAKEIVEETSKAISEWVGFIAHELRTPISGLLQFSQLGLRKLNDGQSNDQFIRFRKKLESSFSGKIDSQSAIMEQYDQLEALIIKREERYSKSFDRIHLAGDRLGRLLNELLDLSKLESGKMEFIMERTDLMAIVQEAADELEAIFEAKMLKLEIEMTDLPTEIIGDSFRIGQVVRNLLHNAIKFSHTGTTITVLFKQTAVTQGRRQGDEAVQALQTTIRDQGIGIPADQIGLIFNKFKQSRKTKIGEGSGLGLPICKEIILAHSGIIWAESQEDHGTEIHFALPYQNARAL